MVQDLTGLIKEIRENHSIEHLIEGKKGARYHSDERIIRYAIMDMFERNQLNKRPTTEQFLEMAGENMSGYIKRALNTAAEADWHYENPDKWT